MRTRLEHYFNRVWYQQPDPPIILSLLSFFYRTLVAIRKKSYHLKLLKSSSFNVPVIIVGNLTVGGTGKTPLVIWLTRLLIEHGYQPGVISRGYGGQLAKQQFPAILSTKADPALYGDEAVLIAQRSECPVAVGKSRVKAAQHLLSKTSCDVIISDDGLQHLALERDIEILVIDGTREFGNQQCLPAGPLREPIVRINDVDFLVCNNGNYANASQMTLVGDSIINLINTNQRQKLSNLHNQFFHVVTAIGNPERFLDMLSKAELEFDTRIFADHHQFNSADLEFNDHHPLLMTEKDAVKCYDLANTNTWMLPVDAHLEPAFSYAIIDLLEKHYGRPKTA